MSLAGSALVKSLPPVLGEALSAYAADVRHGDMAAAATDCWEWLCVGEEEEEEEARLGYRVLGNALSSVSAECVGGAVEARRAVVARRRAFLVSLVRLSGCEKSAWDSLVGAFASCPALAYSVAHDVAVNGWVAGAFTGAETVRRAVRAASWCEENDVVAARLRAPHVCMGGPLPLAALLDLAEASAGEVEERTVVLARGRPGGMQARVDVQDDGSLFVRLDSLNDPGFWAEFTIPASLRAALD